MNKLLVVILTTAMLYAVAKTTNAAPPQPLLCPAGCDAAIRALKQGPRGPAGSVVNNVYFKIAETNQIPFWCNDDGCIINPDAAHLVDPARPSCENNDLKLGETAYDISLTPPTQIGEMQLSNSPFGGIAEARQRHPVEVLKNLRLVAICADTSAVNERH